MISRAGGGVAERQGFEPWVGLHPQRFSKPSRSTTPAPLRAGSWAASTDMRPLRKWKAAYRSRCLTPALGDQEQVDVKQSSRHAHDPTD